MTETAGEAFRETKAPKPQAGRATGAPIALRVLYVLGLTAGVVLLASLVFVLLAWATDGGGGFGLHVSTKALVVWLGLAIAAGGTFVWRRWGRPQ